jgi:hypothetical protein
LAWLTSFLIHKGSSESRDSEHRMEEALERIERRLIERAEDILLADLVCNGTGDTGSMDF